MPPASATGAIRIAFLMLLNAGGDRRPDQRAACSRRCTTVFREGSLLDPRFPASTIFGNQMCDEVLESIMLALAEALPDRVTAGWNQFLCTALAGIDPRTDAPSVSLLDLHARRPGRDARRDGYDALGFTGTPGSMRVAGHGDVRALDARTSWSTTSTCPTRPERASGAAATARARSWRFYGERRARRRRSATTSPPRAPTRRRACSAATPAGLNELRLHLPDGTVQRLGLQGDRPRHPAGHRLRARQRRRRRLRRPASPRRRSACSTRCATGC